MSTCKDCLHYEVCGGFTPTDLDADVFDYCRKGNTDEIPDIDERCGNFKPKADYVEVVRCENCKHSCELAPHSEISPYYRHCNLWRGEETKNVWHKYKKYYADYSIVEPTDFCSYGERKENNA